VLALNPFFVLEFVLCLWSLVILPAHHIIRNDPTPDRGAQLPRAASLIVSSLGFIHDLRKGLLVPDSVRGVPLDMDQYSRLFGAARIPTQVPVYSLVLVFAITDCQRPREGVRWYSHPTQDISLFCVVANSASLCSLFCLHSDTC
jgi:Choline/Carnitine o-acyltransferase